MKLVEWLVEAFFTIKLFLSPALVGGLIGAYVYLTAATEIQKYSAYGIWTLGVLSGILLAWKVKKKQAAVDFLSRIHATPELDKPSEADADNP